MTASDYYHLTWSEFHRDTRQLAAQLLSGQRSPALHGIVAIARGGLVPAAILARELELRWVESLCIASYDHEQQGELEFLNTIAGDGAGILLVDDLADTGATARAARDLLPEAYFATVYTKPAGRSLTDEFVREFPQDTWLHFPWDSQLQYSEPLIKQ